MLLKFLFPTQPEKFKPSFLLLLSRLLFGGLLLSHGLAKAAAFSQMADQFPDPLHVGSSLSLCLAIFGEVACPAAVILGFLHRLALIPMAFTMGVAFFAIHGNAPFAQKELAFVYLAAYILLWFAGAGRFSIDHAIGRRMRVRKR